MTDKELAIRKIEGVLRMVQIGNSYGFDMCNMKATEKRLREVLLILREESR